MTRSAPARAILATSCVALLAMSACSPDTPAPPPPPPAVTVTSVAKADGVRELRLSGTLAAERSFAVGFATLGTVEQVFVQEGQAVEKGQLLAKLADRSFRDALGIAEAKARQADDAYRRLLPMHQNKTLPEVKFVEVETGREQTELAVSMARKNVADTELRAPVSGVVQTRHAEVGTSVTPGLPAFTLVQTATMDAVAPVPETQVGEVRRGGVAHITVPALGRDVSGTIREISVAANPLTRTYDVKVSIPNPDRTLRVGMIAEVRLPVATGRVTDGGDLLAVPPQAVRIDEQGRTYVFAVGRDRKIQRRPVTVARFVGELAALSSGVQEGDVVVTSGTPMLYDGLLVRIGQTEPGQVRK